MTESDKKETATRKKVICDEKSNEKQDP